MGLSSGEVQILAQFAKDKYIEGLKEDVWLNIGCVAADLAGASGIATAAKQKYDALKVFMLCELIFYSLIVKQGKAIADALIWIYKNSAAKKNTKITRKLLDTAWAAAG
jgi:hypothetical protein